jgi:hypothetical protein
MNANIEKNDGNLNEWTDKNEHILQQLMRKTNIMENIREWEADRRDALLLAKKFKVKRLEDWYQVKFHDSYGSTVGTRLLNKYHGSQNMLKKVYCELDWHAWKFRNVPRKYWMDMDNQRAFLEWMREQLVLHGEWKSWIHVTADDIQKYGGGGLLSAYNFSPSNMIISILPELKLKNLHFPTWKSYPKKFWYNPYNRREFLLSFVKDMQLDTVDSLEKRIPQLVRELEYRGGARMLQQYRNSVRWMLQSLCPEYQFSFELKPMSFKWGGKSNKYLTTTILSLLPNGTKLMEDVLIKVGEQSIRLRNYIPSYKISVQFPSLYYYDQLLKEQKYLSMDDLKRMDDRNKELCKKHRDITIIYVPHWWDGKQESLANEIAKYVGWKNFKISPQESWDINLPNVSVLVPSYFNGLIRKGSRFRGPSIY